MLDSIQPKNSFRSERDAQFYPTPRRNGGTIKRLVLVLFFVVILAGLIAAGSRLFSLADRIFKNSNPFSSFTQFFLANDKKLNGEDTGEIRFLLMGIGGENHEGGTLTDTMIVATLSLPKNESDEVKLSMVSIPRDLVVDIPGYDYRKINSAYAYAEMKKEGAGADAAVQTVEKVIGEPIPYYAVLDFQGFKKIIDDLGGIDIYVENGFTDSMYPDLKKGYLPPVVFKQGWEKMDGERALQYVRSRHGNNNQGTDFARSKRQEQVLQAAWEKIKNLNLITNLGRINQIVETVANHFRTNLQPYELRRLYDLAHDIKKENIYTYTIDQESGLVCSEIEEGTGAYILIPCPGLGNYSEIRDLFAHQFEHQEPAGEKPVIEIQNATQIAALAAATRDRISIADAVITIGNFRGTTQYNKTVIYDNTSGKKPKTLQYLREKLGAEVSASRFPFATVSQNPDFVIVIVGG